MNLPSVKNGKVLLFYCTRQDPDDFPGLEIIVLGDSGASGIQKIEVPCSGRVGTGELMQGLAAGYEKVAVLSCGESSCLHGFGCAEAKKAMNKARGLAGVTGVKENRLIFIEADDVRTS